MNERKVFLLFAKLLKHKLLVNNENIFYRLIISSDTNDYFVRKYFLKSSNSQETDMPTIQLEMGVEESGPRLCKDIALLISLVA